MRAKTDFKPEVALVLGSGLGDYAEEIEIKDTVDYTEIEGFPSSTVAGHKGRFVFGYVKETPVVIMQGRVHYYEGYPGRRGAACPADGTFGGAETDTYQCSRRS